MPQCAQPHTFSPDRPNASSPFRASSQATALPSVGPSRPERLLQTCPRHSAFQSRGRRSHPCPKHRPSRGRGTLPRPALHGDTDGPVHPWDNLILQIAAPAWKGDGGGSPPPCWEAVFLPPPALLSPALRTGTLPSRYCSMQEMRMGHSRLRHPWILLCRACSSCRAATARSLRRSQAAATT